MVATALRSALNRHDTALASAWIDVSVWIHEVRDERLDPRDQQWNFGRPDSVV